MPLVGGRRPQAPVHQRNSAQCTSRRRVAPAEAAVSASGGHGRAGPGMWLRLALHYIENLDQVFRNVWWTLRPGGTFLFNIEHPVFTSGVHQEWIYGEDGTPKYWPVDDYYRPGQRVTRFLGCEVIKHHHTLTQILMGLLHCGFTLEVAEEVQPSEEMLEMPGMKDEMRRPMMLLVRLKR